jgi:site-specific DNA-methyltransferase (adenine-specific)
MINPKTSSIHKGDCLELMKEIPDGSIDMILCDLPYGTTDCKWDTVIPFGPLWGQYKRVIKDNGAIVLFGSQPFTSALIMSNLKGFAHSFIWDKKFAANFVQAKRQPLKDHEEVIVFSKTGKQPLYFPQMVKRDKPIKSGGNGQSKNKAIRLAITDKSKEFGDTVKTYTHKFPTTQLRFNVRTGRGLHPTQKPVPLFEYLIKTYTNEGETVLDNCAGSFTTAVACLNTERKYICMEQEGEYFALGENRIAECHKAAAERLF